jgi:DNA-binding PadR family transcriptional regulator
MFLLFCAKTGMGTPYSILNQMGVGVGASSPALKRLESQGFVSATPGPRNRVLYELTEKGEEVLREAINAGPSSYGRPTSRGIYEAMYRVIFFAWLKGDKKEAQSALDMARETLQRKSRRAEAGVKESREFLASEAFQLMRKENGEYASPEYLGTVYKLILAVGAEAEARLQIAALDSLRKLVDELPPRPKTFLRGDVSVARRKQSRRG